MPQKAQQLESIFFVLLTRLILVGIELVFIVRGIILNVLPQNEPNVEEIVKCVLVIEIFEALKWRNLM